MPFLFKNIPNYTDYNPYSKRLILALPDFKEKIEGFKNSISKKFISFKAKFSKNKVSEDFDDEFEEEYEEDEGTAEHNVEDMNAKSDFDEDLDDEFEDDDFDENPPPKDKKRLIIQAVIGLLVVFIVADEFLGGDSGDDPTANLPDPPKRKKKLTKKPKKSVIKEKNLNDLKVSETPETSTAKVSNESNEIADSVADGKSEVIINNSEDMELKDDSPRNEETIAQPSVSLPEDDSEPGESEDIGDVSNVTQEDDPLDGLGEGGEISKEMDLNLADQMASKVNENEAKGENKVEREDTLAEYQNDPKKPDYKKVLESIDINETSEEEIISPEYERRGRGLVYNCKEKHWACVDRVNYFRCAKVQKFSATNGRSPSCVSREVFYSSDHCARGQLKKIHSYKIPPECKK